MRKKAKKLSLRWRLTLMTAVLVAIACVLLNILLSMSAIKQMNDIENAVADMVAAANIPGASGALVITPRISEHFDAGKNLFQTQSLLATLAIITLSSLCTWVLAGQGLKPLQAFSERIEEVQASNLSTPVDIDEKGEEVLRLTTAFNRLLLRLHQVFDAQRRFSASAAHELRTPLAVMQTNLDVFQKESDHTAQEYRDFVGMMRHQIDRMSRLVATLLEMVNLTTVRHTDQVELSDLAEEVMCDLSPLADEKKVSLLPVTGSATVQGSDLLLYRAIYNLVENAIKYNRAGGTVQLAIGKEKDRALVTVRDTGIGIPRENRDQIFEPFYRVDKSRSRAMGGVGLGLALVSEIAAQHDGAVRVRESSEEGTVVELTLPMVHERLLSKH